MERLEEEEGEHSYSRKSSRLRIQDISLRKREATMKYYWLRQEEVERLTAEIRTGRRTVSMESPQFIIRQIIL